MPETHAAKHTGSSERPRPLFAPTPTPRASAGTVAAYVFAMVLILGGFYLMSAAFSSPDMGLWIFAAGLFADVIGFWFAFGILPSIDSKR